MIMKQASLTTLRRNLSNMLNAVNADSEPLIVTRRRGKPVVLMSLEDYQAMKQTDRPAAADDVPESAAGLWKALSDVDEMRFVPSSKPEQNPRNPTPKELAETAPAFRRHPSR